MCSNMAGELDSIWIFNQPRNYLPTPVISRIYLCGMYGAGLGVKAGGVYDRVGVYVGLKFTGAVNLGASYVLIGGVYVYDGV